MREQNAVLKQKIVDMIDDVYASEMRCPTLQQIADALGVNKSTVSRNIAHLIDENRLTKGSRFGDVRTIKMQMMQNETVSYPVVGDIACGLPIFAEENIQSYITFSKDFIGAGDFFILRAKGNSMIEAGISDGDLVVIRCQNTAEEGQIIVALIDNEATLKRYYLDKEERKVRLHSENAMMEDMYYDNVSIQGIAVKVIKDL